MTAISCQKATLVLDEGCRQLMPWEVVKTGGQMDDMMRQRILCIDIGPC